jgi:anti-sigma regulatory factor (Ser/Thr protein kinase)
MEKQFAVFDVPGDLLFVAQLLISEVATNAIKHTRAPEILVRLVTDHYLEVSVHDPDARRLPRLSHPSDDETSGRGLALVDALAAAWGTDVVDSGKWVWFRLDLPP